MNKSMDVLAEDLLYYNRILTGLSLSIKSDLKVLFLFYSSNQFPVRKKIRFCFPKISKQHLKIVTPTIRERVCSKT